MVRHLSAVSICLSALVAACSRPPVTATTRVAIQPHAKTATLPNGLFVVFDEDHRSPIVSVNVTYGVGGKDDPPHRSGLAHFYEHMMFQGSEHVPTGAFATRLIEAGARYYNGTTTSDRTGTKRPSRRISSISSCGSRAIASDFPSRASTPTT
jgi:hypothetical protein